MNDIREFLKDNVLIKDGAAGTYLAALSGRGTPLCEALNIQNPDLIAKMHYQYVKAGAQLILTNTFGASVAGRSMGQDDTAFSRTAEILREGVRLARSQTGNNAYIAADIGPLPEENYEPRVIAKEYRRVVDVFISEGIDNFSFETFASSHYPLMLACYIKNRLPRAFISISFAVLPDGFSRAGISGQKLITQVSNSGCVDAAGFNCCSGPTHLLNYALTVDYGGLLPVIAPNAGYPQRNVDDDSADYGSIRYAGSPEYFAETLARAKGAFKIIGGCCGTTPRHIECLSKAVRGDGVPVAQFVEKPASAVRQQADNPFKRALFDSSERKVLIVEVDPPFNSDIRKVEAATHEIKAFGATAVTVADSPMARPRADSITVAARLKRVAGIEAIPHLCCRDRNINALKSALIAAHMEGVRNILAVTGDPVPDTDRGTVKSVFNVNSVGLCRFVDALNGDIFAGDEMLCGCAFNVNARNIENEILRLKRKVEAGAAFTLTQPVFSEHSFEALRRAHELGIKVLTGILTPVSYKNIMFLANEMPGFTIPDKYISRFSPDMTREEGEKTGIAIAAELAERAAGDSDGFYFIMPFNRVGVVKKLAEILQNRGAI